jgi:signal transduction histidine kinase
MAPATARSAEPAAWPSLLLAVVLGAAVALAAVVIVAARRDRQAAAPLRRALEASSLGWWRTDKADRIVDCGPGAQGADVVDWTALRGRPLWSIGGDAARPSALAQAMTARRPFKAVRLAAGRGPSGHTLALSGVPVFNPGGEYHGYAGTVQWAEPAATPASGDVATLHADLEARNRELAERSHELENAVRELDSFSHSVSHDLRAPLRVVDGFATIVLEDYGDRGKALDDLGREHLRRIIAASQRMNTMIDTLLGLSRTTSRELRRERVDLSQIARELADDLRAQDGARTVEFVVAAGLKTDGDATLLRLVLQNLLGNAYKFTAQNRDARIEFGVRPDDGRPVYFVRDNGAGFDMRFAEKMFGLFQRFHSANEFPGTGVGLATVQKIVRRHSGRVWAEAVPAPAEGHGATFYFTLWEKS